MGDAYWTMDAALRRERVVVAQADLRQGPARAGPPRLAVLPALRHRAVRPRARAGVRDGRRPVGLRALPRHRRRAGRAPPRARAADLDDDAVDPGVEHRGRRSTRTSPTSSRAPASGELLRRGRGAARGRARRGRRGARDAARQRARGDAVRAPLRPAWSSRRPTARCTPCSPPTSSPPRTAPASCTWRRRSAPDDLALCRGYGLPVVNPLRPDGTFEPERAARRRRVLQEGRRRARRRPRAARPAVQARAVRAHLPALLALPHAARLLRAAVLVHPHHRGEGRAARARTRAPTGTRRRSSGAGTATGCTTTSTGRSRAAATGARRCRSGAASPGTSRASSRSPTSAPAPARTCRTSTRTVRSSTTSPSRAPSAARPRRACPR